LNDRVRGRLFLLCLSTGVWGCATSYQARGLVLRVDPTASMMTVSHDSIPGYMDAMAMPFAVRDPRELKDVSPGDVVSFRLRPRRDGSTIDRIKHLSASAADSGLTMTPSVASLIRIGDSVPDFSLVDQHGSAVTLSALRGRVIAVTFIYSRCPLPDYCPLVVANLAQIRDRYRERLGRDLVLLTVSFDPKYDSPDVLRSYAARYGGNIPGWHFLTGSPEAIAAVCASFGIEYWPDQGLITHTLQTAVVDRQGRLAASVEGRGFTARQIADLVGSVLDPG
jgi:protein SCO1/2